MMRPAGIRALQSHMPTVFQMFEGLHIILSHRRFSFGIAGEKVYPID